MKVPVKTGRFSPVHLDAWTEEKIHFAFKFLHKYVF